MLFVSPSIVVFIIYSRSVLLFTEKKKRIAEKIEKIERREERKSPNGCGREKRKKRKKKYKNKKKLNQLIYVY